SPWHCPCWRAGGRWCCGSGTCSGGQDAVDGGGVVGELVERDPFVGGMRLGDVARSVDQGGQAGGGEQRGLGPEVDGVADGQAEFVGEIAGRQAPLLGAGDVTGRQRRAAEGFLVQLQRGRVGEVAKLRVQLRHV